MAQEELDKVTFIVTRWLDPEERDCLVEFLYDIRRPIWRISHATEARNALDEYGRARIILRPGEERYAAYIKLKWG